MLLLCSTIDKLVILIIFQWKIFSKSFKCHLYGFLLDRQTDAVIIIISFSVLWHIGLKYCSFCALSVAATLASFQLDHPASFSFFLPFAWTRLILGGLYCFPSCVHSLATAGISSLSILKTWSVNRHFLILCVFKTLSILFNSLNDGF